MKDKFILYLKSKLIINGKLNPKDFTLWGELFKQKSRKGKRLPLNRI